MGLRCISFLLSLFTAVFILGGIACSANPEGADNGGIAIASLTAAHTVVYPLGNTAIECVATSPDGTKLNYQWTSNDGKIYGSGSKITWEAPKTYGDFHIMATVDDGYGHTVSKAVTVTVIVRDGSTCCK
ncbi:MAG: hypothetical protein PHO26_03600 [Dehalococcoidia bacterium]|nr:hypothetical protein [Dehalococcoidia bacterium]MDD5494837.1 hypothetical protein [Dehalococcoidia bacterium]